MTDRKLPIGTRVDWRDPETKSVRKARVVRHGRDAQGVYTELKAEDGGERYKCHRSTFDPED